MKFPKPSSALAPKDIDTSPSSPVSGKGFLVIPKLTQSKQNDTLSANDTSSSSKSTIPSSSTTTYSSNLGLPETSTTATATKRISQEEDEENLQTEDLKNIAKGNLVPFRKDPVRFMIRLTAEGSAFFQGSGWRRYEDYIGAKIFYPGYWQDIYSALLKNPNVQRAMNNAIQEEIQTNKKSESEARSFIQSKIKNYAAILMSDMSSKTTVRFIAFVVNNLLVRLYHQGIYIKGAEFLALKKAAEEAASKGISLIFLPCHRSHVDYLVISYVFYRLGLALPHIAAGQNLNIPVVGNLLRKGGAFFIRRTFGNDPLYSTLFKEYIELLMVRGHNIEAFIEGTRSRTGKLLPPRFGIIKIILDAVMNGRVKDVMLVPLSIGYDRVIETASYVNELLGTPKQPESLGQLVNSTSVLQIKWGRIDVRFHEPWSLQSFLTTELKRRGASGSSVDQVILLRALSYRILSDINEVSVIMPSALVGTSILTFRGRGVSKSELSNRVDWLRKQILKKGAKVAEFGDSTKVIVERVIGILGSELIGERQELLEPVYHVKKRFELSFYRNQVIHLFITESIVCTALETLLRDPSIPRPTYSKLLSDVIFLSQLFKREFIYPPYSLSDTLNRTLTVLNENQVLSQLDTILDRDKFDFYCFLLWPFVDTYWLSCLSLLLLDPVPELESAPWILEKKFIEQVQLLAKTLYYEGELTYFESINLEVIKNAWTLFIERGVLHRQGNELSLDNAWRPHCTTLLTEEIMKIHRFRRDKDGVARFAQTIPSRVLRLVDLCTKPLANIIHQKTPSNSVTSKL